MVHENEVKTAVQETVNRTLTKQNLVSRQLKLHKILVF